MSDEHKAQTTPPVDDDDETWCFTFEWDEIQRDMYKMSTLTFGGSPWKESEQYKWRAGRGWQPPAASNAGGE